MPPRPPQPPPSRHGVGASTVVLPAGDWPSVLAFLVDRFPAVGAPQWVARMARGDVVDTQGRPVSADQPHREGLKLHYYREVADEPPVEGVERVLYQDAHLVVADKPHFLPVTPGGQHLQHTLLVRLRRRLGLDALAPLHRLDRETAGLVLFSPEPATRARFLALFRERRIDKRYEAVVHWPAHGAPALPLTRTSRIERGEHFMQMRECDGEPNAVTELRLIERLHPGAGRETAAADGFARLALTPLTGRTHQLRVHCAALGVPIAGDTLYPRRLPAGSDDPRRPLQLLAQALAFDCPITGEPRRFRSGFTLGDGTASGARAAKGGGDLPMTVAADAAAGGANRHSGDTTFDVASPRERSPTRFSDEAARHAESTPAQSPADAAAARRRRPTRPC